MTMLVIEGDILRVVHLGVTKAVLFRDRKIMVLTEEQSVANRFAQMGSNAGISPDDPASMEPTQYLGKMPQEGELRPEKKVHLKLRDNDEIILMGLGISKGMPVQMRNSIIIKPVSTEEKAKEIINAAVNNGVKSGLTIIDLKVESTFLLPGDAVIRSNLQTEAAIAPAGTAVFSEKNNYTPFDLQTTEDEEDDADDTINFVPGNAPVNEKDEEPEEDEEEEEKERGSAGLKIATVVMPIIIFVLCLILGFGIMFLVFNIRDFIESNAPETMASAANGSVYYAVNDNTPVYSQPSLNSTVIATLNKGDVVTVQQAADPTFSKVVTSGSLTGYCLTAQLSQQNPAEAVPSESSQTSETNPGESANGEPADTEETTTETEEPEATPTPTPKPVKKATATPTPKPVETEPEDTQPAETAKPTETQKPAETEKPAETQKPAETTKKAEDPKPEDPKPEGNE